MTARVRYLVPPGGTIGLSEARLALYSWMLARHLNGQFLVRFAAAQDDAEGTPRADLRWLGLTWDLESPPEERAADTLREWAAHLAREGAARVRPGQGIWLAPAALTDARWHDLVRGEQAAAPSPAGIPLLDADGRPSLHLSTVVRDRADGVTHVVRDSVQVAGTADYLLLCNRLGLDPPVFAHLPAVRTQDGPKPSLRALRQEGYLGLAVANYVARIGWSPRGRRALLDLSVLADRFDPARVARSPVVPDRRHLAWYNHRLMARMPPERICALFAARWRDAFGTDERAAEAGMDPDAWRRTLAEAIRTEVHTLDEAVRAAAFAFVDAITPDARAGEVLRGPPADRVLADFGRGIAAVQPFDLPSVDAFLTALRLRLRDELGIRSRDVLHVVRAALTGNLDGPCVVAACLVLGRERCVARAAAVRGGPAGPEEHGYD